MHPRNRYKEKTADFLQLSRGYPSLQPYIIQRSTEIGTIDFSNPKAVKELTKALLAHDFELKWDVNEGHLVPTIPLRLNYLHWIEDLLSEYEGMVPKGQEVVGLDIGVGASCIYPLLGVKMNRWRFYGTEIAENSFQNATENISMNGFNDVIVVAKPPDGNLMLSLMESEWKDVKFSFVMCNPPFYASIDEKKEPGNRTPHRPSNSTSQQECRLEECVTEGGELTFVKKIIEESLELRNRVTWFSSMLGKKCHVRMLTRMLQSAKVPKIVETEFVQGKTRRWGIGWSFNVHFKSWVPLVTPSLQKPLFLFVAETSKVSDELGNVVRDKLSGQLEMEVEIYEKKMIYTAYSNTWCNQRKKRRLEKVREIMKSKEFTSEVELTDETRIGAKRKGEQSEEVSGAKALKIDTEDIQEDECLIEFIFEIKKGMEIEKKEFKKGMDPDGIYLRFEALETSDKEYLHQIVQYVKNNIKI